MDRLALLAQELVADARGPRSARQGLSARLEGQLAGIGFEDARDSASQWADLVYELAGQERDGDRAGALRSQVRALLAAAGDRWVLERALEAVPGD